jgi:hypothetical protein
MLIGQRIVFTYLIISLYIIPLRESFYRNLFSILLFFLPPSSLLLTFLMFVLASPLLFSLLCFYFCTHLCFFLYSFLCSSFFRSFFDYSRALIFLLRFDILFLQIYYNLPSFSSYSSLSHSRFQLSLFHQPAVRVIFLSWFLKLFFFGGGGGFLFQRTSVFVFLVQHETGNRTVTLFQSEQSACRFFNLFRKFSLYDSEYNRFGAIQFLIRIGLPQLEVNL